MVWGERAGLRPVFRMVTRVPIRAASRAGPLQALALLEACQSWAWLTARAILGSMQEVVPAESVDRFRRLARSSPWLWRSIRFTVDDADGSPGRVPAQPA